jgi:P27 family predicted phage terminase small subunit
MAKTGRKNKPTMLRLLDGNAGRRPLNKDEPQPPRIFKPRAPNGFTKPEKSKWHQVCKRLAASRLLTIADLDAVEIYVRNWCWMMDARADILANGKMIKMKSGGKIHNPSYGYYKFSLGVCRSLQSEFGMTPSARAGLVAEDDAGKSAW